MADWSTPSQTLASGGLMGAPEIGKQCSTCVHLLGMREVEDGEEGLETDVIPYCEAFPLGIPDAITRGRDHRMPYRGDHGIRFQPITAKAPD
jgi:hypothetical protein